MALPSNNGPSDWMTVAHASNDGRSRILICGYYGEHNLGDDALLTVLLNQLDDQWLPVVTARDQRAVQALAPAIKTVDRRSVKSVLQAVRHIDALILGGGSLLQDSTSFRSLLYYILLIWRAKSLQKPVILWGQGLGPLKRPLSRWLVRSALQTTRSVSWRDSSSMHQALVWKLKVPMVTGPDPVWSHPAPPWRSGDSLILCWRPTPLINIKGWIQLVNALSEFSAQHDLKVIWLAFHGQQDANLLQNLSLQGIVPQPLERRSSVVVAESIDQVQRLFSDSRMVIAMRLHALILASVGGVPTSALSYDPKVKSAAQCAGVPCTDLGDQLSEALLLTQWKDAMNFTLDDDHRSRLAYDARIHSRVLNETLSHCLN